MTDLEHHSSDLQFRKVRLERAPNEAVELLDVQDHLHVAWLDGLEPELTLWHYAGRDDAIHPLDTATLFVC